MYHGIRHIVLSSSMSILCLTNTYALSPFEQLNMHIDTHAEEWIRTYIPLCSYDELQLLANILYLSHLHALFDSKIRIQQDIITNIALTLRNTSLTEPQKKKYCLDLKHRASLLHYYLEIYQVIDILWKHATTFIEHNEHNECFQQGISALDHVIDFCNNLLSSYSEQNRDQVIQELYKEYELYLQKSSLLQHVAHFFRGLIIDNENNECEHIALFTQSSHLANHVISNITDILTTSSTIAHYQVTLEEISQMIFINYYTKLYAYIIAQETAQTCLTYMFNVNGIINDNMRTLPLYNPLPSNNV